MKFFDSAEVLLMDLALRILQLNFAIKKISQLHFTCFYGFERLTIPEHYKSNKLVSVKTHTNVFWLFDAFLFEVNRN